ncbi:MAG: rod shape-determining protein MreC [Tannerellaceae bacterium]|nr:rod shape-determining protein MreC [Tannerellaceae bacterium]
MRELIDFLVRKRHWFLFLLLEIISFAFIYRSSVYQRNVLLSTANIITGNIISVSGSIRTYFYLSQENRDLLTRNGQLEMELLELKSLLSEMSADTITFKGYKSSPGADMEDRQFDFITARVVNNSVARISNYITINKGAKDGITSHMGVVSDKGVVGIVSNVSDHYSVVLPVLNPKFRLSGKVSGSSFGTLMWDGRSPRYANLSELARHVEFAEGDTVVTSGYSSAFPEGVIIGTIASFKKQNDDNFYTLQVELATDFHALTNVRVIKNNAQTEQRDLEEEVRSND